ncbi:MAG: hypothetical protein KI790_20205 [Cyclobacteriaceae bacterium]|nr:hypothetical protein [Cyclobacteriaceae bacterium HetDA_MAG_MS6]
MRFLPVVIFFCFTAQLGFSQSKNAFFQSSSLAISEKSIGLVFNLDTKTRFNNSFYNDYQHQGLQVISINQSATNLDMTFYVDQEGVTQYRSFAPTANMNLFSQEGTPRYDSFNPYGADYFGEAIMLGVLNTLFNSKKVRFLGR